MAMAAAEAAAETSEPPGTPATRTAATTRRRGRLNPVIAAPRQPALPGESAKPPDRAQFQALLGEHGRVFAPRSLDELAQVAASSCRQTAPSVIAVHGGDGTLHKTVTALVRAFGDTPLPPVAALCGGTMNVVAPSLGIREQPHAFVQQLAEARAPTARPRPSAGAASRSTDSTGSSSATA